MKGVKASVTILGVVLTATATATAGPIGRVGAIGGYDTSAPGGRDDGITLGAGYVHGPFTIEGDYAYFDYDGTTGVGGGANRIGVLAQGRIATFKHRPGETAPHLDVDLFGGYRWLTWQPEPVDRIGIAGPPTDRHGSEVGIGLSMTMVVHFALRYVLFQPAVDGGPMPICRGTCPMRTDSGGTDPALLLEASFVIGG